MRQTAITLAIVMGVMWILLPFLIWSFRNLLRYFRNREWEGLRRFLVFSWHLVISGILLMLVGILGGLGHF